MTVTVSLSDSTVTADRDVQTPEVINRELQVSYMDTT